MNISYSWLKDLIGIEMSAAEVALQLTRVGLTVEGVHPAGDDFVLDIDLTSNRPDCLSHLGVARELRVITGKAIQPTAGRKDAPSAEKVGLVTIQDADLCPRFTGRIIRNVSIGPSPDWIVKRLEAVGERSINNVADITNYVMLEVGQPMHAFDLDKLSENRIVVRRARPGEAIQTLDEVQRNLGPEMLAICDAEKPAAVGGIMGGLASSITNSTSNVLLEVAYFKRENIRQTSRKLGLTTEASYRFERGVDIERLIEASNRAAELICDLAGGTAEDFVDVYPDRLEPDMVKSNDISAAVRRLTGLEVNSTECERILSALGIERSGDEPVYVSPTWRHDIYIEEDLVEEIARHTGYENIKDELPPSYGAGELQPGEVRKKLIRQSLVDMGFDEAISYSFIDTKFDGTIELVPGVVGHNSDTDFVTLRDSVIEGAIRMRPTMLPGLLEAVRLNFNHHRRDVKLFEIGKVFARRPGEESLPTERELLAMVVTGGERLEGRAIPTRELDFFDAKGAVETALEAAGLSRAKFQAADARHLRKGQAAAIELDGKTIGYLGRLSDQMSSGYKFRQAVYVAEFDLQQVLDVSRTPIVYTPLSRFPAIVRDVSLVADRSLSFESIRQAVERQGRELCRRVEFVDVFEGKGLADHDISITIRLEYRSDERTLLESEVEDVHASLIRELEERTGARQRSY